MRSYFADEARSLQFTMEVPQALFTNCELSPEFSEIDIDEG